MRVLKFGPKLHIQVHVSENKIHKTHLVLNDKNGTSWELIGCSYTKTFEKNIDQWFLEYCSGSHPTILLDMDYEPFPSFTQAVLDSIRSIAFGKTSTYQQLALISGNPHASRAAGNACGRNPIPLFIPCHRVLGTGKRLGGFSLGLEVKKTLLSHENIPLA